MNSRDPTEQPSIELDARSAKLRYSDQTWPCLKLPWPDYPQQFAQFLRLLTEEVVTEGGVTKSFSRVDIRGLRVVGIK
jgi:hypothetical protein